MISRKNMLDSADADILTLEQAKAYRQECARQNAYHCVLLAVVTSEEIAADLIDRAILYAHAI